MLNASALPNCITGMGGWLHPGLGHCVGGKQPLPQLLRHVVLTAGIMGGAGQEESTTAWGDQVQQPLLSGNVLCGPVPTAQ